MTTNLTKILLDTSLIDLAVRNFDATAEVKGPTPRSGFVEYSILVTGEKPATLQVFERKTDGLTTLHTKVGANQALSQKLGEHVANACRKKEYKQRQLSLEAISSEHWGKLIEHFTTVGGYEVVEEKHEHAVRFRVTKGPGDNVLLHRFTTGRFLMQGKCRDVYAAVSAVLCALVPDKRGMLEAQLKALELDTVKADDLLDELRARVPSAMAWLGDVGAAIIAPCLAATKVKIGLSDYSLFTHPAFRGLEAYMKGILAKFGYAVQNELGFRNYFNGERLRIGVRDKIASESTSQAVETSYSLYNKHRHSLFHVDANVETSRIIEDQEEAIDLINEVLQCLEDTASSIV